MVHRRRLLSFLLVVVLLALCSQTSYAEQEDLTFYGVCVSNPDKIWVRTEAWVKDDPNTPGDQAYLTCGMGVGCNGQESNSCGGIHPPDLEVGQALSDLYGELNSDHQTRLANGDTSLHVTFTKSNANHTITVITDVSARYTIFDLTNGTAVMTDAMYKTANTAKTYSVSGLVARREYMVIAYNSSNTTMGFAAFYAP